MINYTFSKTKNEAFATLLKQRIKAYFQDNQLSSKANGKMVAKTVMALSTYLLPFLFILFSGIDNVTVLFVLYILMGLGKAFIGTSVMHDVLHGSYSWKDSVNTLMNFSALIVGVYPNNWKVQHNVLHHTFTNVEHADEDISPMGILRFTPHQTHRWIHKYQHIYVIFFYSIFTLTWSTIKDFVKLFKYRKEGFIKAGKEFWKHMLFVILSKIFYFSIFLILPMWILPVSNWLVLLLFLTMHLITGFTLSMVFQIAHIMPTSIFIEQEQQQIEQNYFVHQLLTTSNYAMDNKLVSWFVGGLNFQVEHHMFPHICHVHYPQIAKIVQQTTKEFNLPYYAEKNLGSAIVTHFRMIKALGRGESGQIGVD